MSLGRKLGKILIIINAIWLAFDFYIWKKGKETLSQYLIKKSLKSLVFTIMIMMVVLSVAAVLIWHWELVPILVKHLAG